MVNDRGWSSQSSAACGSGGKRESEDESDQRGLNTKLDLARDQNGRPIRAMITAGTTADRSPTGDLRPRIQAQH
ncbi:MAG: hypothetical protein QGH37_31580 [Candidatus Poribacteria bacterium]|nr:hypothetical protein [Candidatus Poribacteria bacterium]MDP6996720.1 hypothetical protein [Candidatus Poribacteria bacterium]